MLVLSLTAIVKTIEYGGERRTLVKVVHIVVSIMAGLRSGDRCGTIAAKEVSWRDIMSKERRNRREFFGLAGAGLAGAAVGPWLGGTPVQAAAVDADADLVVFNAVVYTIDTRLPRAEAFAAKGGRFIAVGTTADIKG